MSTIWRQSITMKTAWLVTWEWIGDHAKVPEDKKIAAIFNWRWSGSHVKELVEQLYISHKYTAWDKIGVAKNPKGNPYPALYGDIEGVPWQGMIHCGDNPFLHARLVNDLCIEISDEGPDKLTWKNKPKPKLPRF